MVIIEEIKKVFSNKPVKDKLSKEFGILFVTLFGSTATGLRRRGSDIDLGILFSESLTLEKEEDLVNYLRDLLRVDRLDAVCLNDASCALRYELTQDGILLFERDQDRYLDFCIRTFKQYEEMNFLNRHYHEMKIEELRKFAKVQPLPDHS